MKQDLELEELMGQIGQFGRYQFFQHILHLATSFLAGIHMLHMTFTANTPSVLGSCSIHDSIPEGWRNQTDLKESADYIESSRVLEYGLFCNRKWMRNIMQTMYMFGVLWGGIGCGTLADRFGRKPVLVVCGVLMFIISFNVAFISCYEMHMLVLFFYGMFGSGGAYVTGFVLSMELVGARWRVVCGSMFSLMFTVGCLLLDLGAYLVHLYVDPKIEVKVIQMLVGLSSLLLIGHYWLCDESIRWLWTRGKHAQAIRIAKKAARWNGLPFDDKYSDVDRTQIEQTQEMVPVVTGKKPTLIDLFKTPVLRMRLLNSAYNWFANSIVYYGISFNTNDLAGDRYLNFCLSSIAELPGILFVIFCVKYTGQRTIMACCLFFGGLMCFVALFTSKVVFTIFSLLAKVGIALSFTIVYNHSAELFPTVVRNSAIGFCTMSARISGMISPLVGLVREVGKNFEVAPVAIFGVVACTAAIWCFFLPETLSKQLPETMEDGENFEVGNTAFSACCGRGKKSQSPPTNNATPIEPGTADDSAAVLPPSESDVQDPNVESVDASDTAV